MDRTAFTHMAAAEATHWWFVGRRAVIDALLDGIHLPTSGQILEAGCGTGGNLAALSRRGQISAFEPHIDALAFARERHPGVEIREAALPSPLPYEAGSFDLVAALDVLEHVADDGQAAAALAGLIRPGGWLLVTVPAHQALWGSHDRRLHHVRRYGRLQMQSLFDSGEMDLVRFTPFNMLLAPIAVVYRAVERALGLDLGNQERLLPAPMNSLLARAFAFESALIRRGIPVPFGLSYAALYRRRQIDAPVLE
jgi:SAM-dependent methyltransferase